MGVAGGVGATMVEAVVMVGAEVTEAEIGLIPKVTRVLMMSTRERNNEMMRLGLGVWLVLSVRFVVRCFII